MPPTRSNLAGTRALRVTPRGQRAIGKPVTVAVTLDVEAIRGVVEAAEAMLSLVEAGHVTPLTGTRAEFAELLDRMIRSVRLVVELAAADAGVDDPHL